MYSKLKSTLLYLKRRPKRTVVASLFAAFVLLNVFAFVHARAMTHFVAAGKRTPSPEQLSLTEKAGVLLTGIRLARPENQRTPDDIGLEYTTHTLNSSDEIELEAWHIAADNSRGICLLFHGYAESKGNLLDEARGFHEMGYDVLLVDFRGCGGSQGSVTTIGYSEADDVAAAVAYAETHFDNETTLLYGRSMGSAAVLRAIAVYDLQPAAVMLECPFDRLLSTAQNRFSAMGLPAFPCANLLIFWGGVQLGYSGLDHNPAEYAAHVQCPTLLMRGERDTRVTSEQMQFVSEQLQGQKQSTEFTNLSHEAYLAAVPIQWKRVISDFLEAQIP